MIGFINDIRKDELDLSYENIPRHWSMVFLEDHVHYMYASFNPHPKDKAITFTCEEGNDP